MNFFDKIKDIFKPREQQSAVSRAISSAANNFRSVGNYVNQQFQQAQQQAMQQQAEKQALAQQRAQQIQQQQAQRQAQRQQFFQQQANQLKQKAQEFQFNRQQEQLAKGILAQEGLEKRKEQVGNLLNKANNFFAPVPDKVRPRDVIREGAQIVRDVPRGIYNQWQDTENIIYPNRPQEQRYTKTPIFTPQTTGEKVGSFLYKIPYGVTTGQNTGINQTINQGLQTFSQIPQVKILGKDIPINANIEAAKDWIGNNLQKLKELEIDSEKLRQAYDTLGIKQGTDPRDAYRELAKVAHPDRGGNAEAFKVINEAYKKIQDAGNLEKILSRIGVGPKGKVDQPIVNILNTQAPVSTQANVPVNTSETAIVPFSKTNALDKILNSISKEIPVVSQTAENITKNVPKVVDKVVEQKTVSPLEQILQNRAKELGVTPSLQPKPIEDKFEIPPNFKEQNLQKSVESAKAIINPRAVDRLLVEGFHPGTIKNVLQKAVNPEMILANENYAYNYFKKVARDQKIKPDPDVKAYLKPEIKEPELPQDYEAGLDSYEPEGPLPKVPDELLEQLQQQNIDQTKEVKNIDQILQPKVQDTPQKVDEGYQERLNRVLNKKPKTQDDIYEAISVLEHAIMTDGGKLNENSSPEEMWKAATRIANVQNQELDNLQYVDFLKKVARGEIVFENKMGAKPQYVPKNYAKPKQKIEFKKDYPLKTSALPEQLKSGMYYPDIKSKEMGVLQADINEKINLNNPEFVDKEIQQNQKLQQEALQNKLETTIEERIIKLKDVAINSKTDDEIQYCVEEVLDLPMAIEKEVLKTYKTFEDAVNDLESKKAPKNKATELIKSYYDNVKEIAEQQGIDIPTRKDFFTHITEERAREIVNGGIESLQADTFGSVLSKPYFAEKRTNKLVNYTKTPLAMQAYGMEALKNIKLSEEEKITIKNAADIKSEYKKKIDEELSVFSKIGQDISSTIKKGFTQKQDVVTKNQIEYQIRMKKFYPDKRIKRIVYSMPDKSKFGDIADVAFRSVSDRAELAGDKFYNAFFKPFRYVELDTNIFLTKLKEMSPDDLLKLYTSTFKNNPKDLTKEQIIAKLTSNFYSEQLKDAINVFHDNSAIAYFKQPYLKDLANDIFDEYVGDNLRAEAYSEKVLAIIRKNQGRSLIFFNISSAVQNLFEPIRVFSLVKTKNAIKALRRVISGEDFVKKWGIEQTFSTVLERKDVAKVLGKIDKIGYAMFSASEKLKDQIFVASFEEQGLDKGLTGEELRDFIVKKFDRYAIKYGKGQTTGVFKNPVIKTALQFEQYGQKELVNLIDQIREAIKGDKGSQHFLQKYFLYSAARMGILKAAIGAVGFGGSTGTPLDMISDVINGDVGWSPAVQATVLAFQKAISELNDEEDAYKKAEIDRNLSKALISTSGIPGVNQLYYKSYKGLEDILSGEHQTTQIVDKAGNIRGGNVANPTSQDLFSIAKIFAFGPSYDPQRQDYIKRYLESEKTGNIGEASLNKVESEIYRQQPTQKAKEDYYYNTIAEKKQANVNKDQLENIKNGKSDTKEGNLIQRLFGKDKEEEIKITTPAKNKEEQDFQKDVFFTKLDQGLIPTTEEIKYGHFENKSATDDDIENRITTFNKLAQIYNDENYSDEQKKAVFEASGATKEELDYFLMADKDVLPRIQELLPIIPADPKERLEFLANGRKTVGGKDVISSQVITYLEDRGYISEDEAKFLRNTKYDELNQEFYWTGDFGPGGGDSKKISAAQAKQMYPGVDASVFEKLKDNSFASLLKSSTSKSKVPTIEEILANRPKPQQKEGLWFDVR